MLPLIVLHDKYVANIVGTMPGKDQRDMKQQGAKSQGDAKSRDARKFSKAGKGGKVMLDGMSHHERLDGDEMFNGALDRGDPNYDLDGEMDALSAGVSSMAVGDSAADTGSASESIFQPGGSEPADLTAWTNPNGGTAAMAGEFKMDFEGKRETVTKERVAELVGQAQENGKVDYKKVSFMHHFCEMREIHFADHDVHRSASRTRATPPMPPFPSARHSSPSPV